MTDLPNNAPQEATDPAREAFNAGVETTIGLLRAVVNDAIKSGQSTPVTAALASSLVSAEIVFITSSMDETPVEEMDGIIDSLASDMKAHLRFIRDRVAAAAAVNSIQKEAANG